ncbi:MAG: P1 family peptidase [Chloroflexi bacterium]|nr:P1 family peptidase [Chloroflexota bacterium]
MGIGNAITDVEGILVGHATDLENATGCTVILCPPDGAVGGVDVRGPAPGTRETDLMRPGHLVERVNAILLAGGSAFGLDAASGVMRFLEEKGIGFDAGPARVPIVPAAVIFDLGLGSAKVRPTAEMGYRACLAASTGPVQEGTIGAGTGATVGHLLGNKFATKGGLGTASQAIGKGIIVGAILIVNAFGDVVDPSTREILAGTRKPVVGGWLDSAAAIKTDLAQSAMAMTHTTIGVVATNAALTKEEANLVAMMAHDGLARAIQPAHALYDGDALFALSVGKKKGDVSAVGHAAAEVVAQAIVRAINAATSLGGIPARRDLK